MKRFDIDMIMSNIDTKFYINWQPKHLSLGEISGSRDSKFEDDSGV
jgi:hypothetical protein